MNTQAPTIRHDLFGLTSTPFLDDPPTPFLDPQRTEYLALLARFAERRGFAAVTGRSGSGKTALVRYFTQSLHPPAHKLVYLAFTSLSENDLLKAICIRLDCQPPHAKGRVIHTIQERIRQLQPVNPVLILDEMQNASPAVMDTVRLLANDHFDADRKLSCILIGTHEFLAKLRLAINESLRQRITLFCNLREISPEHVADYLQHCLRAAGAEQQVFDPAAVHLIADASKGSIRQVKQIAADAMAAASEQKSTNVALAHVHTALNHCLLPTVEIQS